MRASLGQPIIVENISGADGSVGTGRAARARPDGYTIELGTLPTHVLNGAFYSLRYDVLNDFVPILLLDTTPFVLFARKDLPARNATNSLPGAIPTKHLWESPRRLGACWPPSLILLLIDKPLGILLVRSSFNHAKCQ
jgi:hypothetical protein